MENISKKIFCKDSGRCFGYVLDICLDFEKFEKVGYYVVEEESENEYFLSIEKILSVSSFLIVENETEFEFVSNQKKSLFGKRVVSLKGEDFESVDQLKFVGKRLISICTNKAEMPVKFIRFVGEDVIFVSEKRKVQKRKVESKKTDEILVSVLSNNKATFSIPEKVSLTANFYVGKLCHRDIFGYNNERLVAKGEMVNALIFEKAKTHNKLNELYFAIENKK